MKGLELSRRFWEELLYPALREQCGELLGSVAAGLCGAGSDCLGYDDEISRDHAFAAGCMLFVPESMSRADVFRLSAVYDRLPREFMGFAAEHRSRQGDGRYGVKTVEAFFRPLTGCSGPPEDWRAWLRIPSHYLAEAAAGQVFYDGDGRFSALRRQIALGMPEDVRLKKIAARAALMAQSGQYNFARCRRHGEEGAARLAGCEFVRQTLEMVFLLNRRHMPYYKWAFRALRELPVLSGLGPGLEQLLAAPTEESIETISAAVIARLREEGLTDGDWDFLEPHAYSVMKRIRDPEIAALHVMEG